MKKNQILIMVFAAVIMLILASGVSAQPFNFGQNQEISQVDNPQPESVLSLATHVSEAISYQGVLEENGVPVTGTRDMSFSLYADDGCVIYVSGIVEVSDVPIENGLFSVQLDLNHSYFTGQALYLEVEVEGNNIACQEILAVPYALSLRPGAVIATESTDNDVAAVTGEVSSTTPGSYSTGLRGINKGTGGTGIGVYGSQDGGGWGVFGQVGGNGRGVYGRADGVTGIGVSGVANGTNGIGVYGQGSGSNSYALKLSNGAIGVNGAGLGTSTPVFIHQVTDSNRACGINSCTVIDHPMTNGDPNAMLIVTQNFNYTSYSDVYNNPHPVGAQYFEDISRWVIYNVDMATMTEGAVFAVLVVKP